MEDKEGVLGKVTMTVNISPRLTVIACVNEIETIMDATTTTSGYTRKES